MNRTTKRLLLITGALLLAWLALVGALFTQVAAWIPTAARLDDAEEETPQDGGAVAGGVPARYRSLITRQGTRCPTLTPARLAALLQQESGFNPRATSDAGARGIAQFMPATWATHGYDANRDGIADVFDPKDAIPSAARYLCTLADTVKTVSADPVDAMLAAYNAGPGAVKQHGGVPPFRETQKYVQTIRAAEKNFTTAGSGGAGDTGPATGRARRVLAVARAQLGTPYVWGGGTKSGPSSGGFDCSGLLIHAFWKGAHLELPRTSQQMRHIGQKVPKTSMRPGDIVVIDSDGNWGHVVLYAGNGRAVEAPRTGLNVRNINLNDQWGGKTWDVRRVL